MPQCLNSSGGNVVRDKLKMPKISFHSFPDVKLAKGKRWVKLICRDPGSDFGINKNTRICSDHFASTDFLSLEGKRRRLKLTAIPSYFPWTKNNKRMSMTSQKASEILTTDDALKQSTCLDSINIKTGSITSKRPFCVTPEIMEKPDEPEELIMEEQELEQDEQNSVTSLQNEVVQLKSQLAEAEMKLTQSLLRLENIN